MAEIKTAPTGGPKPWQFSWQTLIFVFAAFMLTLHLFLWLTGTGNSSIVPSLLGESSAAGSQPSSWLAKMTWQQLPLLLAILIGGLPLIWELLVGTLHGQFGSDLLAAVSILTSLVLGEYLAGTIVVMMLSGGQALERYAVRNASSVLNALAQRMPSVAYRLVGNELVEVPLGEVVPDELIVVGAHETCPVDGVVVEGHGAMDESYLSGEPYRVPKSIGSEVMSGQSTVSRY